MRTTRLVIFLRLLELPGTLAQQNGTLGRQVRGIALVLRALDFVLVFLIEEGFVDPFVEVLIITEGRQTVVALGELLDVGRNMVPLLHVAAFPISIHLYCRQNIQLELQGLVIESCLIS